MASPFSSDAAALGDAEEAGALVQLVFNTVADFMLLFRQEGNGDLTCVAASGSWQRATGRTATDSLDHLAAEVLPRWAADRLAAEGATATLGQPLTYDDRVELPGGPVQLAVTVTAICSRAADGSDTRHILWVGRDVTEQRAAERAQEGLTAELERSNADLAAFASVASHDLQEPLRMVTSYVELLSRRYGGELDDRADTYIGFALDGAQRMRALITSLLEYAQVRSAPARLVTVDLAAVVDGVVADLRTAIAESGAEIRTGELPVVAAPEHFDRVIQNLVANALKFRNTAPPVVAVGAAPVADGWCITVDDNGIGIPENDRHRVFDMLTRLHARQDYPGTGMGLALCRGIVERHDGRIEVGDSALGGTRVTITLPQSPIEGQP